MSKGSTYHYERDSKGVWWVVWGADFLGDVGGRTECPNSYDMEIAYQEGYRDGISYRDAADKAPEQQTKNRRSNGRD